MITQQSSGLEASFILERKGGKKKNRKTAQEESQTAVQLRTLAGCGESYRKDYLLVLPSAGTGNDLISVPHSYGRSSPRESMTWVRSPQLGVQGMTAGAHIPTYIPATDSFQKENPCRVPQLSYFYNSYLTHLYMRIIYSVYYFSNQRVSFQTRSISDLFLETYKAMEYLAGHRDL